ncbi:hypothetical protein ACWGQ4_38905, partial [Streptomyces sp. NPDC055721]
MSANTTTTATTAAATATAGATAVDTATTAGTTAGTIAGATAVDTATPAVGNRPAGRGGPPSEGGWAQPTVPGSGSLLDAPQNPAPVRGTGSWGGTHEVPLAEAPRRA